MVTTAEIAAWCLFWGTVFVLVFLWKTNAVERILSAISPAPAPVAAEPTATAPVSALETAQHVAPSPPTSSPQPRKILSNSSETLPPRRAYNYELGISKTEQHTRKKQATFRTDGFRLDAQPRLAVRRSRAVLTTEMVLAKPTGHEEIKKSEKCVKTVARKNPQPSSTRVAPCPVGQYTLPVVSAESSSTVSATTTKPVEDKVPTLPSPPPTPTTQSVQRPLPTAVPETRRPSQIENETPLTVPKLLKRQQSRAAAKSTGCMQHINAAGPQKIAKSGKSTKHRVLLGCKHYAVSTIPSKRKALVRTRRSFVRMELPESPEIMDICTKLSEVTLAAPYTALTPKETAPYTYSVWPYNIHDIVWAELAKHASQLKADDGGDKMVTDDDMPATVLQQGQADTLSEDKMEIEPTTTPSNRQSTQQVAGGGLDQSIHAPSTPYMSPAPTTNTSFGAAIPFNQPCTPAVGQAAATQTPAAPKKNGPVPFQITPSLSSNAGLVQQPAGSGVQPDDTMEIEPATKAVGNPPTTMPVAQPQSTPLQLNQGSALSQQSSGQPHASVAAAVAFSLQPTESDLRTPRRAVNGRSNNARRVKTVALPPLSGDYDKPKDPDTHGRYRPGNDGSPSDAQQLAFEQKNRWQSQAASPSSNNFWPPAPSMASGSTTQAIQPIAQTTKGMAPSNGVPVAQHGTNSATVPTPTVANTSTAQIPQPTAPMGQYINNTLTGTKGSSAGIPAMGSPPGLGSGPSGAHAAHQTAAVNNNVAVITAPPAAGNASPSRATTQTHSALHNPVATPTELPGLDSMGGVGPIAAAAWGAANTSSPASSPANTTSKQDTSSPINGAVSKPSSTLPPKPPTAVSKPSPNRPQQPTHPLPPKPSMTPPRSMSFNPNSPTGPASQQAQAKKHAGAAYSPSSNTLPPSKQGMVNSGYRPSPLGQPPMASSHSAAAPQKSYSPTAAQTGNTKVQSTMTHTPSLTIGQGDKQMLQGWRLATQKMMLGIGGPTKLSRSWAMSPEEAEKQKSLMWANVFKNDYEMERVRWISADAARIGARLEVTISSAGESLASTIMTNADLMSSASANFFGELEMLLQDGKKYQVKSGKDDGTFERALEAVRHLLKIRRGL